MKYLSVLLAGLLAACGGSEKPAEPTAASAAEVPAPAAASMAASTPSFTPVPDIKPVWQIMDIAGQPQAAVLGQPQGDCENNKYGKSCRYSAASAEWEIVYIKGKADWLTLTDKRIDNAYTAPVWIGLPSNPPTVAAPARLAWDNYPGLLEVSAHMNADKSLQYLYIKTVTP